MKFLVARSGYSIERTADDLSLILEDHIDSGWRCNICHVSDHDTRLGSGMGVLRMVISALSEKKTGELTSL